MAELDPPRDTVIDELRPPKSSADPKSACLVVIYGDDIGRRISLGSERLLFGRERDCGVSLDDETTSRYHAEIITTPTGFSVRDLGSTNGTYVGDATVMDRPLVDGDQIKIGRSIFKFLFGGNIERTYHEVIYDLMTHDGLTQAHNRRYFEQQLARELGRAARYGRSLGLLLFDIDHFKQLNDKRGHLAGDELLRQLAKMVLAQIRAEDLFARIGGEEFAILLPEASREGATVLAERLRSGIENAAFRYENDELRATCSFGVAALTPTRESTSAQLLKPADEALYRAKEAGRNRVSN